MPQTKDFQRALDEAFREAEAAGSAVAEIAAGELHRRVGGYPGGTHRMPLCCSVMRRTMRPGDAVVYQPRSGQGASLRIRYALPRARAALNAQGPLPAARVARDSPLAPPGASGNCAPAGSDRVAPLIIVPCGRAKVWDRQPRRGAMPAREAYTGAPFKVNRRYAECFATHWVILSAKYGFVPPDFVIPGPYNVTIKDSSANPIAISALREQIRAQGLDGWHQVIGLGGKDYREVIEDAFAGVGVRLLFPFAGLSLFDAMRATKRAIELGEPRGESGL